MLLLRILIAETLVLFGTVLIGAWTTSKKADSIVNTVFGLVFFAILFTIMLGIAWAPS